MKTTVKLSQLRDAGFAQQGQVSLIELLYTQKPDRGGSKIAYRIASLRATIIRLMGPDSVFEETRGNLVDEYHETKAELESRQQAWQDEHKKDNPLPSIPNNIKERQFKASGSGPDYFKAISDLFDTAEEIDVELFPLDAIDAAGYSLSGAEIDALTGLLVQPEPIVEA